MVVRSTQSSAANEKSEPHRTTPAKTPLTREKNSDPFGLTTRVAVRASYHRLSDFKLQDRIHLNPSERAGSNPVVIRQSGFLLSELLLLVTWGVEVRAADSHSG